VEENMSDEKKEIVFAKKWKKYLPVGFEENAESMPTEELKAKLIEYQKDIAQAERDRDGDEKLNDAKESAKELGAVYKDIINANKAMTQYVLYVMEGRGE
jgi:hypothetical protein